MSSDVVHADPADVKRLAKSLQQFEQRITQVTKEGLRAIERANWHDRQKDQFTARYKDFNKRTTSFVGGEVKQMVSSLNKLATQLEKAQSQRF